MLSQLLEIYDVKTLVAHLNGLGEQHWSPAILKRVIMNAAWHRLSDNELTCLKTELPTPPSHHPHYAFRFIDLFAGIGGIRRGFEAIGGQCVFTSEWNKHAVRTYKANYFCDPLQHRFNEDIRDITLSHREGVSDDEAAEHIRQHIPQHDVLLAGFPCQPFSLAGVSKKNALGRAHGFACETQGTLFFDVVRIIDARRPALFVLENVKNLKSHDQGNTFRIIMQTLDELGYDVADAADNGPDDPKIIDGQHFLPQHRERIVLVGFRRDLNLKTDFYVTQYRPLLSTAPSDAGRTAGARRRSQIYPDAGAVEIFISLREKAPGGGNGFGYGMVYPDNPESVARTLSARYYKDGAEILIDRGWDMAKGEVNFYDAGNQQHRPRRLTPRECARLMGFEAPQTYQFRIPVSDTQAYRQFGNSVVVPVFAAVAKLLEPKIHQAVTLRQRETADGGRSR